MFHLKMPFCQTTKLGGPRSDPLSIITWSIPPSYYTRPPLLPSLCLTEMRHWQIFIRRPIPARARRSPLFYFTDQALSQDEGFVCASLFSSPPLMSNWYICGCDSSLARKRVLLGMIKRGEGQPQMTVPMDDGRKQRVEISRRPSDKLRQREQNSEMERE